MYALPKVEFLTAVKNCLKNYINFKGRIRRSEYWFFLLPVNFITVLFLTLFLLYLLVLLENGIIIILTIHIMIIIIVHILLIIILSVIMMKQVWH